MESKIQAKIKARFENAGWIVVKLIQTSCNGIPDLISFDHDLADEHIDDYFKQKLETGWQQPAYET